MKKLLLLAAVPLLLLSSCRSAKKGTEGTADNVTQPTTTVVTPEKPKKDVDVTRPSIAAGTNFTSKVKVTITQDDKDITTSGTLRMRYDDVIQITLVDPLLGIAEIGRLELSPDRMLLIDRINKRYVDTSYDEFAAMKNNHLDFATIQRFFWQEAQESETLSYSIPAKTPIKLDLRLSNKGNAANWNAHTDVSDKYTKTDANRLFNTLIAQ